MRIRMNNFFFAKKFIFFGEPFDYFNVSRLRILFRFYEQTGKIFYFRLEFPIHSDMLNKRQIFFFRQIHVVLAESRRDMNNARAFVRLDEIRAINFPSILAIF